MAPVSVFRSSQSGICQELKTSFGALAAGWNVLWVVAAVGVWIVEGRAFSRAVLQVGGRVSVHAVVECRAVGRVGVLEIGRAHV